MTKTDAAHLVPALFFGGLIGIVLLAGGVSLVHVLLAVIGAYVLVSLLEVFFELSETPSAERKS
jgi:hypothetical protein